MKIIAVHSQKAVYAYLKLSCFSFALFSQKYSCALLGSNTRISSDPLCSRIHSGIICHFNRNFVRY